MPGVELQAYQEEKKNYKAYLAQANSNPNDKARVVVQLAEQLIENNRFREALNILQQHRIDDPIYRSYAFHLISYIYSLLNRFELRDDYFERATVALSEDAAAAVPDTTTTLEKTFAQHLSRITDLYEPEELDWKIRLMKVSHHLTLNRIEQDDEQMIYTCLAWAKKYGEHALEVKCLHLLGQMALIAGHPEKALKAFQEAYEQELSYGTLAGIPTDQDELPPELTQVQTRAKRIESGVGIQSRLEIGRLKALLGADPLEEWNEVIAGARRQNKRLLLYHALNAKAGWLRSKGRTNEAIPDWEEAVDILDGLRTEFGDVESQLGVLKDKETTFANLLLSAVEHRNTTAVLRLMERAKARALLETMGTQKEARLPALAAEKAKLTRQALIRAMREEMKTPGSRAAEINVLKEQLAAVYNFENTKRTVRGLSGGSAEDVIRYSMGGKAVLHYFVAEEKIVIAGAVNGTAMEPVLVECTRENLSDLIDTFGFEIDTLNVCYSLAALYAMLIGPVEEQLKRAEALVIIPHDLLHRLPFHALRQPDERYFIEDYTVSYVPSIAVASRHVQEKGDVPKRISLGFAAGKLSYVSFPPLNSVEKEIQALKKHLPGIKILEDIHAVRRMILQNNEDTDVLHFACHGDYDTDDPLLSRLYLGDGPLYGYEIERLSFTSRLVVLSACETGIQHRAAGDESFGLTRAFLSSGARAVMASLWKVSDESTGMLMEIFYQFYAEDKKAPAAALREAQLKLVHSEKYGHPFWWSCYALTGH